MSDSGGWQIDDAAAELLRSGGWESDPCEADRWLYPWHSRFTHSTRFIGYLACTRERGHRGPHFHRYRHWRWWRMRRRWWFG